MAFENVSASPLAWPLAWPRAKARRRATFRDYSVDSETRTLLGELRRLGADMGDVVVSTNLRLRQDGLPRSDQARPADPGVAVYFSIDGAPLVLACDRWDQVQHNLRAIALHVESIRGQGRWGVGNLRQAFAGYAALPAAGETYRRPWWEVLGFERECTLEAAKERWRELARAAHPDAGGDPARFRELSEAWAAAQAAYRAAR